MHNILLFTLHLFNTHSDFNQCLNLFYAQGNKHYISRNEEIFCTEKDFMVSKHFLLNNDTDMEQLMQIL